MPMRFEKARENFDRSIHPDLRRGEDGSLEFREDVGLPPNQMAFRRMWADEAQRGAFMARLSAEQLNLPRSVQESVAGREYPGDAYQGYREYLADIGLLRQNEPGLFTAADVDRMSLEEYDRHFDERGQPRPGVAYEFGSRDVDVSARSGVDPFSSMEFRQGR